MDCKEVSKFLNLSPVTTSSFRACVLVSNLSSVKHLYRPAENNFYILLANNSDKQLGHFVLLYITYCKQILLFDSAGVSKFDSQIKDFVIKDLKLNNITYKDIRRNDKKSENGRKYQKHTY